MLSFEAFRIFVMVVYAWFVIGAGVIGFFAAKELGVLLFGVKEKKGEVEYEV